MTQPALPSFLLSDSLQQLTQEDVETLRHMVQKGMGQNTLRALASDMNYLEHWYALASADGGSLPWPPSLELVLQFVAHHLYDRGHKLENASHGMPQHVEEGLRAARLLRTEGPHRPATVRRRLSTWATMCKWRGVEPVHEDPRIRKMLRLAVRAQGRRKSPKSAKPVGIKDVLAIAEALRPLCAANAFTDPGWEAKRLSALRDSALIGLGFASGGRRRSEIASLRLVDIQDEPIVTDAEVEVRQVSLHLGRTKTRNADTSAPVYLTGAPVEWLAQWVAAAGIDDGSVFRSIDRWGRVGRSGITPDSVNRILKKRLSEIGKNPADFSAHGLRSGFITEALSAGIPLAEVMAQTQHVSVQQAASYFRHEEQRRSRAAHLLR